MTIAADLQKLSGGTWVELFQLDTTMLGGGMYYFHCGTNALMQPIVWQGQTYTPWEIQAEGFGYNGAGAPPRPKLRAANVSGILSALLRETNDLLGAKVTRKRTMVKYLDAVNFPALRNLLTYTQDFNSWSKSFISATQDGTVAPDGDTAGVWLLSKTDTGTSRNIGRGIGVPALTQVTASVYFRAGPTNSQVSFGVYQNLAWAPGSNPKVVSGPGSISLSGGTSLTNVTGLSATEWTKVSVTATVSTSGAASLLIYPGTPGSNVVGRSVYAYAPQVEYGPDVTEYQPVGATRSQNPTADPLSALPDEVFYVVQKTAENRIMVELELGTASDLAGVSIPRQSVLLGCRFRYRGTGCGYAGGPVADIFDRPTTDPAKDVCSHRLSGCKLRFGTTADLPYGGFPGAGTAQNY